MTETYTEILITSDSDYEKLTAEIYCEDKFVALLNQDNGLDNIIIEFPGNNVTEDAVLRKLELSIFEKAIAEAKSRLKE